jgi:hypothetical protein
MTNTPEPSAEWKEAFERFKQRLEVGFAGCSPEYLFCAGYEAALSASPAPSQSGLVETLKDCLYWAENDLKTAATGIPNLQPRTFAFENRVCAINQALTGEYTLTENALKALRTNDQTAPVGLVGEIKLEECDTDEQVAAYWREQCQIAREQLTARDNTALREARSLLKTLIENDPNDSISDAGHVVLDLWRHEARQVMSRIDTALAGDA